MSSGNEPKQPTRADEIQSERDELAKSGRLHWVHWSIVILSGALTLLAWQFAKSQVDANAKAQFDRESSQVVELVTERMQRYEDALWSGVAAIEASGGAMSLEQWRVFASSLHIELKYPGINGIGVIEAIEVGQLTDHVESVRAYRPDYNVYPGHSESEHLPIVYIEPEAPNAKAIGLDIAHELNRYTAAKNAREKGNAQITGPIILVQDSEQTPGFLFYAPYYDLDKLTESDDRETSFVGMVYAPFVVKRLMAGTLEKDRRHVGIRLSDGGQIIYDENGVSEPNYDVTPMFATSVELPLYGREWRFDIQTTTDFRQATSSAQPIWILIGGMTIDLLLLSLFLMMSRASRRTLSFADRMNLELKRSVAELETFAYAASHDLKTPVRGIADLVSFLQEDMATYLSSPDACPEVDRNLKRIVQQTNRMEDLIHGILEYSGIGRREEPIERVDVAEIIDIVMEPLNVRDDQLIVDNDLPVLRTSRVRLQQVLANLIGNAFKFHDDPDNAVVTVSSRCVGNFVEFTVSDNGPGIEERFHGKIFDVFESLHSKDEIEGSGVGLSIVKKSVEALGGQVEVRSVPGDGADFKFSWPRAA